MLNETASGLRTLLFVPVLQEKFVLKSLNSGADAIILDLEDSIAPTEKEKARAKLPEVAAYLASNGARVIVRINSLPFACLEADLGVASHPSIEAVLLPKAETANQIRQAASILRANGPQGASKSIIALTETPLGICNAQSIATADSSIVGLAFGSEDYTVATGGSSDESILLLPAQMMAMAARAAGVAALGLPGSLTVIRDEPRFRAMVVTSRAIGMTGVLCVHPTQVAIANTVLTPSDVEIEDAGQIKSLYEAALAEGTGAITYKNQMIDIPHYQRALRTLARTKSG